MAKLNRTGRANAETRIKAGDVDKTSAWSFTAGDGNALLGTGGDDWVNYGRWHLGVNPQERMDTKAYYQYPFGKGDKVYRSGLIAIRDRASQQKDNDIYTAAGALLDEIDGNSDRTHENRAPSKPENTIRVENRPPRIEILPPRGDFASAPVDPAVLDKWKAGIRADSSANDPDTIQIFDVIGADPWTGGGITADSVSQALQNANGKPVTVQINSPGGDMFEGIAIYEALRQYQAQITVQVLGLAASSASVIAMAGDNIQMGQAAFLMIHNCWVMAMGNQNDLREVADYLAPFDAALCGVYQARSAQPQTDIQGWMNDETWINAADAVKLGFADSIMTRAVQEDTAATEAAKQLNSVRKVESLLTKKGGMTRSAARDLIQSLKGGTQDAAASVDRKPGAAGAMHDAGRWISSAKTALEISEGIQRS